MMEKNSELSHPLTENPQLEISDSLEMFQALNSLLQSVIHAQHESVQDVILKILKTCQDSVINLSVQFLASGLFETIVDFL